MSAADYPVGPQDYKEHVVLCAARGERAAWRAPAGGRPARAAQSARNTVPTPLPKLFF